MSSIRNRYRAARAAWTAAGHPTPSRRRQRRAGSDTRRGRLRAPVRPGAKPAPARADWWQRGTAIGGLVSVLLVAVGLYLTNDFNRDQYRLQQDSARQQQDLALKGQRADRFVKAVDQLGQEGNDKLGIRLGGIYALETLMRDSPNDENTIIEVLCAFVRTHAPLPKIIPKEVPKSPFDVRAALAVLGRRPNPNRHTYLNFNNTLLGLAAMDLRNADLYGADLHGANLYGVDLNRANLTETNLTGANLQHANLQHANLTGANLTGANLTGVGMDCTTMDALTRLPPGVPRSVPGALERRECKRW